MFEWKSSNSLKPNKARQVKSKLKSIFIIFVDMKVIVHKEFILAGQTVIAAYCCDGLW
jgi:hypothetical protein